jgi:hypothetical protein
MRGILLIGVLAALVAPRAAAQARSAEAAASPECRSPEHRQFDFWIGDWDAYDLSDTAKAVARIQVTPTMGGCVLREVYDQGDGLDGESFSLWDSPRKRWHQSWVTNRGSLLLLEGRLQGPRMVLTAPEWKPDGSSTLLRGMWWPDGEKVRHKAERSADGGKTWSPVWDMVFRPRRAK